MPGSRTASRLTASSPRAWSTAPPSARDRCAPIRRRPPTQARAAQTTRRAFSASESAQFLNRDVLVPDLGFPAAVDLQTNQSVAGNLRIGFRVVHRLTAVDRKPDARAFGADLVLV